VVQLPNLGAGCGICVSQAARYGGLQLAYRASSSSVSAGPAGMHLEEFPGHEGNVHVTRLHCSSVSVTLLLRQIITGEVEREADLPGDASSTLPSLAPHRGALTRIVALISAFVHVLYLSLYA
jgi:hypothetical protein